MIILLNFIFLLYVLIAIFLIHRSQKLIITVICSGIFSLLMACVYLIIGAADVAITEAAVGVSFSAILFVNILKKTGDNVKIQSIDWQKNIFNFMICLGAIASIFSVDRPVFGNINSPIHNEVMQYYLATTKNMLKFPNVVTSILGSFRGYDTLGETTVIMTAAVCILFLMNSKYDKK